MDLVTKSALLELIEHRKENSLSIYMPTNRAGREVKQNVVRFKNITSKAEEELQNAGMRKQGIQEYLQPLHKMAMNDTFWREQEDGLALFLAEGDLLAYRLPLDFDERVYIDNQYYIRPLLPLFVDNKSFYALVLDLSGVKLFRGTGYNLGEIDLEDIPRSLDEALPLEDPEKRLGFHDTSSPSAKGKKGVYHQHHPDEDEKETILRFFHKINKGVMGAIGGKDDPLIPVGPEHLLSLYKETNSYPELGDEVRIGNPGHLSPDEIHERVWDVVQPAIERRIEALINHYHTLDENGRAESDSREILTAAYHGQIESLITRAGAHIWGNFNPENTQIEIYDEQQAGSKDLMELATVHTLLNGGAVYNLDRDKMPDEIQKIAAIKRYA